MAPNLCRIELNQKKRTIQNFCVGTKIDVNSSREIYSSFT